MKFKLFNKEINITDVTYQEPITSNHTGKELEKICFNLAVQGKEAQKAVQKEIPNTRDGGIFNVDDEGNNIKEYKLLNSSYSYNDLSADENTIYSYTLNLEEVENLNIESLLIEDIEVFPYEYEERYSNGAICIDGKIRVTKKESELLDALDPLENNGYFNVIRKGISDKELEMRFGRVTWSRDGEFVKKKFVLVENVYDDNEKDSSWSDVLDNSSTKSLLTMTRNLNKNLIDLLLAKNLISEDEVEEIKEKAKRDYAKSYRDFYQVKDID